MNISKKNISKKGKHLILIFLIGLIATVLSIKHFTEPDLWWQAAAGRWMLDNGSWMTTDQLSYTFTDEPWFNIKWGWEILAQKLFQWLGPMNIYLFQAGLSILIASLLFHWIKLGFRGKNFQSNACFLVVIIGILGMSFRFSGRPENLTFLFTLLYLVILESHRNKFDWKIWLLIPLQGIWANLHEGYVIGLGLLSVYLFISPLINIIFLKLRANNLITYLALWVGCLLITCVTPYGGQMLTKPLNIFNQLQENKFTQELYSVLQPEYWNLISVLFAILLLITLLQVRQEIIKRDFLKWVRLRGIPVLLVSIAFIYLSLTAYRNLPFGFMVVSPFAYRWVKRKGNDTIHHALAIGMCVLIYLSVVTNIWYKINQSENKFGLYMPVDKNPIGVTNYLIEHQIPGNGFVDFLSSSYLLYNFPNFKSYIDLRDLEVFTSSFFENVFRAYQTPDAMLAGGKSLWSFMDSIDHFNYVITQNSPPFIPLNQYLLGEPEFKLCYADGLNSLFLRDSISADIPSYAEIGQGIFSGFPEAATSIPSKWINKILWPFYRDPRPPKTNLIQAAYFNYLARKD